MQFKDLRRLLLDERGQGIARERVDRRADLDVAIGALRHPGSKANNTLDNAAGTLS